ncbi:hypothetical protein NW249_23345 [Streptomyces sp. OUCMDZ-4982]|uniref:hypothetical protein n=1 Tax=Streptomyces sp. OUCMDZ-4982 TaxID=2973090 RepID=UPI00215BDB6C|nr:hypothetical protein [Streptomyces sp. OUCMDZ-4982]MCR8945057.1 hypothetical protein [Streptomyces sp. OUCMDZ-4982]
MTTTTLAFRLGAPDWEQRYPVLIGTDTVIGAVFRWHRDWLTLTSEGEHNLGRPEKGRRNVPKAAALAAAGHVAAEYAAGRVTAMTLADVTAAVPVLDGPVPLLHPRMPQSDRNIEAAEKVAAAQALFRWKPYTGFPGSDNPQWQECELCGWQGPRYWSHQRGRNGELPSTHRHAGCVGDAKVRELITAYQQ